MGHHGGNLALQLMKGDEVILDIDALCRLAASHKGREAGAKHRCDRIVVRLTKTGHNRATLLVQACRDCVHAVRGKLAHRGA